MKRSQETIVSKVKPLKFQIFPNQIKCLMCFIKYFLQRWYVIWKFSYKSGEKTISNILNILLDFRFSLQVYPFRGDLKSSISTTNIIRTKRFCIMSVYRYAVSFGVYPLNHIKFHHPHV